MYNLVFSTVIYKTPVIQIKKLIDSINSLKFYLDKNYKNKFKLELLILDNSPKEPLNREKINLNSNLVKISYRLAKRNLGYGQAHNNNFQKVKPNKRMWFLAINPDVSFTGNSLYKFILFITSEVNLACAAPLIYLPNNEIQYSAKKNPTFLSLISSRFSIFQKFPKIKIYLHNNQNRLFNYNKDIISAEFLSGCFLSFPSEIYKKIGGFSKNYFLHFEDADIVRRSSFFGKTVHYPLGSIIHIRGRGSHNSIRQQLLLIKSYFIYILTWGFKFK
jgi:GT2 family glycosyltransferase